ncbi:MAG: phosphomethylpyrimidine synthase ThiC [Candidatus Lokiarchaeota archaeon]|nr:phosphomethylpyrimidine synthase ThiC [Candidatus Lokiarchaeota archaeon]
MIQVSKDENIDKNFLLKEISKGRAIIMKRKNFKAIGIGSPFRTKINVNIGTSSSIINLDNEIEKVKIAHKYGADTLSDLSMGGDIDFIRKKMLEHSIIPITTVPIYQSIVDANSFLNLSENCIFKTIEKQIKDGISSLVIHAGFSLEDLIKMKGKRIMGMVSKGGSFTASMMVSNSIENPFFRNFEYILELMKERDIVLNLGNAMRTGCIHDKIDEFQISEIMINSKLAKLANKNGVQVILESLGGHINAKDLMEWTKIHKKMTQDRPLFVSGPLPTDFALGYDHVAAAIGGAFASGFGADYLCAITPAEHLCLPTVEDIKNGLIACRIAAHVGDSIKFGLNQLFNDDLEVSKARFLKAWKDQFAHCLDPDEPQKKHRVDEESCTMCGNYCALSLFKKICQSDT